MTQRSELVEEIAMLKKELKEARLNYVGAIYDLDYFEKELTPHLRSELEVARRQAEIWRDRAMDILNTLYSFTPTSGLLPWEDV